MVRRRGQRSDQDADERIDLGAAEHSWWTGETAAGDEDAASGDTDDSDDPYVVLKIEPGASWDEIVASYRRLARWWHPDGLVDPAPGERELCEDMIRRLNIAYTELRVRRGR
jgi:hypothetical protein